MRQQTGIAHAGRMIVQANRLVVTLADKPIFNRPTLTIAGRGSACSPTSDSHPPSHDEFDHRPGCQRLSPTSARTASVLLGDQPPVPAEHLVRRDAACPLTHDPSAHAGFVAYSACQWQSLARGIPSTVDRESSDVPSRRRTPWWRCLGVSHASWSARPRDAHRTRDVDPVRRRHGRARSPAVSAGN